MEKQIEETSAALKKNNGHLIWQGELKAERKAIKIKAVALAAQIRRLQEELDGYEVDLKGINADIMFTIRTEETIAAARKV